MKKFFCSIIAAVIVLNTVGCTTKVQNTYDETADTFTKETNEADINTQEVYESEMEIITQNAIDEFLAITKIPRPGFHLEHIRDYLIQYAEKHLFEYARDDYGNFWMDIPASKGHEDVPKVILQAHMDMVCAAENGYDIDFATTGITAIREGNTITADRTSLGADDGIGIGIIMAIITSDIPHGPIRALITADEDVGLLGAAELPADVLDAEYLINIDDEETNEIICSSAGALRGNFDKQCSTQKHSPDYEVITFSVRGLLGGHSGTDIARNRLSAAVVLSGILNAIKDSDIPFEIGSIHGGTALNAIAPDANAAIAVPNGSSKKIEELIRGLTESLKSEYPGEELKVTLTKEDDDNATFISGEDSLDYLSLLSFLPQGVIAMSEKIDGLVETSSNIGLFSVDNGNCGISTSSRSCVTETLDMIRSEFEAEGINHGYSFHVETYYPGWDGDPDTELIKLVSAGYKKATGADTNIVPIHAGLECSWFSRKHEGIQLASVGAKIDNPHTVNETLYIDTIKPCIEAVVYTLENIR